MVNKIQIEIKEEMNYFMKMLKINEAVPLTFNNWRSGKSGSYSKKGVSIDLGTVNEWHEHPYRTKFVLAHELVHAKYNEIKNPLLNIIVPPSLSLEYLLSELRANTIAFQMLGQEEYILEDYFNNFYTGKHDNILHASGGYLSGKTNLILIKRNPVWNQQAVNDASVYLTKKLWFLKLVSKNQIEKVKNKFINQLDF